MNDKWQLSDFKWRRNWARLVLKKVIDLQRKPVYCWYGCCVCCLQHLILNIMMKGLKEVKSYKTLYKTLLQAVQWNFRTERKMSGDILVEKWINWSGKGFFWWVFFSVYVCFFVWKLQLLIFCLFDLVGD